LQQIPPEAIRRILSGALGFDVIGVTPENMSAGHIEYFKEAYERVSDQKEWAAWIFAEQMRALAEAMGGDGGGEMLFMFVIDEGGADEEPSPFAGMDLPKLAETPIEMGPAAVDYSVLVGELADYLADYLHWGMSFEDPAAQGRAMISDFLRLSSKESILEPEEFIRMKETGLLLKEKVGLRIDRLRETGKLPGTFKDLRVLPDKVDGRDIPVFESFQSEGFAGAYSDSANFFAGVLGLTLEILDEGPFDEAPGGLEAGARAAEDAVWRRRYQEWRHNIMNEISLYDLWYAETGRMFTEWLGFDMLETEPEDLSSDQIGNFKLLYELLNDRGSWDLMFFVQRMQDAIGHMDEKDKKAMDSFLLTPVSSDAGKSGWAEGQSFEFGVTIDMSGSMQTSDLFRREISEYGELTRDVSDFLAFYLQWGTVYEDPKTQGPALIEEYRQLSGRADLSRQELAKFTEMGVFLRDAIWSRIERLRETGKLPASFEDLSVTVEEPGVSLFSSFKSRGFIGGYSDSQAFARDVLQMTSDKMAAEWPLKDDEEEDADGARAAEEGLENDVRLLEKAGLINKWDRVAVIGLDAKGLNQKEPAHVFAGNFKDRGIDWIVMHTHERRLDMDMRELSRNYQPGMNIAVRYEGLDFRGGIPSDRSLWDRVQSNLGYYADQYGLLIERVIRRGSRGLTAEKLPVEFFMLTFQRKPASSTLPEKPPGTEPQPAKQQVKVRTMEETRFSTKAWESQKGKFGSPGRRSFGGGKFGGRLSLAGLLDITPFSSVLADGKKAEWGGEGEVLRWSAAILESGRLGQAVPVPVQNGLALLVLKDSAGSLQPFAQGSNGHESAIAISQTLSRNSLLALGRAPAIHPAAAPVMQAAPAVSVPDLPAMRGINADQVVRSFHQIMRQSGPVKILLPWEQGTLPAPLAAINAGFSAARGRKSIVVVEFTSFEHLQRIIAQHPDHLVGVTLKPESLRAHGVRLAQIGQVAVVHPGDIPNPIIADMLMVSRVMAAGAVQTLGDAIRWLDRNAQLVRASLKAMLNARDAFDLFKFDGSPVKQSVILKYAYRMAGKLSDVLLRSEHLRKLAVAWAA